MTGNPCAPEDMNRVAHMAAEDVLSRSGLRSLLQMVSIAVAILGIAAGGFVAYGQVSQKVENNRNSIEQRQEIDVRQWQSIQVLQEATTRVDERTKSMQTDQARMQKVLDEILKELRSRP